MDDSRIGSVEPGSLDGDPFSPFRFSMRTLRWIWPSAAFDSHDLNERPAVRAFQTIFMDTGMRGDCRLIHPGAAAPFAGRCWLVRRSLLLELFDKPERVTMFDDV